MGGGERRLLHGGSRTRVPIGPRCGAGRGLQLRCLEPMCHPHGWSSWSLHSLRSVRACCQSVSCRRASMPHQVDRVVAGGSSMRRVKVHLRSDTVGGGGQEWAKKGEIGQGWTREERTREDKAGQRGGSRGWAVYLGRARCTGSGKGAGIWKWDNVPVRACGPSRKRPTGAARHAFHAWNDVTPAYLTATAGSRNCTARPHRHCRHDASRTCWCTSTGWRQGATRRGAASKTSSGHGCASRGAEVVCRGGVQGRLWCKELRRSPLLR